MYVHVIINVHMTPVDTSKQYRKLCPVSSSYILLFVSVLVYVSMSYILLFVSVLKLYMASLTITPYPPPSPSLLPPKKKKKEKLPRGRHPYKGSSSISSRSRSPIRTRSQISGIKPGPIKLCRDESPSSHTSAADSDV